MTTHAMVMTGAGLAMICLGAFVGVFLAMNSLIEDTTDVF